MAKNWEEGKGALGVWGFFLGDGRFLLWGLHTSVCVLNARRRAPSRTPKVILTRAASVSRVSAACGGLSTHSSHSKAGRAESWPCLSPHPPRWQGSSGRLCRAAWPRSRRTCSCCRPSGLSRGPPHLGQECSG